MKRLGYPLFLVFMSLFAAAILTTATAFAFASYAKSEKGSVVIEGQLDSNNNSTVQR